MDIDIETDKGAHVTSMTFENSGEKKRTLPNGRYALSYRAMGTPDTPLKLEVKGGKMRVLDRTIPDDGRAAGERTLIVPGDE
jgi:hypothetical protein